MRNVYKILVGKPEGESTLGKKFDVDEWIILK
jgi:hypothetical protein